MCLSEDKLLTNIESRYYTWVKHVESKPPPSRELDLEALQGKGETDRLAAVLEEEETDSDSDSGGSREKKIAQA